MSFHFRRILAALLAVTLIVPVSVVAASYTSQGITDTYDYDAFGNLLHSTGSTPNNYLFAGQQFDADLNLYYNRARYLNVSTGRFWNMDSYEGRSQDPKSLHKYLYARRVART